MHWKRGKRGKRANKLTSFGSWGKIRRERDLAKDGERQAQEHEPDAPITPDDVRVLFEDDGSVIVFTRPRRVVGHGATYEEAVEDLRREWADWDEDPAELEAALNPSEEWIKSRARDPEQAWFWSPRWQEMEREVDEHVARGEVEVFERTEDFIRHLDKLTAAMPVSEERRLRRDRISQLVAETIPAPPADETPEEALLEHCAYCGEAIVNPRPPVYEHYWHKGCLELLGKRTRSVGLAELLLLEQEAFLDGLRDLCDEEASAGLLDRETAEPESDENQP